VAAHSNISINFTSLTFFLLFASSGCRFYCRFWVPLLVAVWQAKSIQQYDIV